VMQFGSIIDYVQALFDFFIHHTAGCSSTFFVVITSLAGVNSGSSEPSFTRTLRALHD
jgi:hypothetical protein